MIKIAFEEDNINMALMLLNQIKVEGVQQAGFLVSINNILTKWERIETQEESKPEPKKGDK
nr:hypothetical protein [uncultured Lachnoclostridium sp.]